MANKYLDKQGLQRVKRDLDIQLADYGKSLSVSIDTTTYVITFQLKNGNTVISEQSVDLPLESVVVGGSYDDDTETIILTLKNGQTIEIPVSDLVSGLVSQNDLQTTLASYYTSGETDTLLSGKQDTIDSNNKLSADLVDDSDTTNKFVSASEKTTWNEKQDELTTSDLDTESLAYYVGFDSNGKLSKGSPQTITIATEVQENNNNAVSSDAVYNYAYPLTNPNGFISGINSTMVTNALGYTPYNASNPSGYQENLIESISIGGVALTITNKNVDLPAYPTKTSLGLDNVVNVGLDNVPTQYSDNGVKSGGVYSAIQDVAEIAEGKTKNYVISDSALTGYVNDSFNSTNDTITITISGNKIKDIKNNDVNLSELKVGDIISITETNVPDRWVGSISGGNIVFYKLETKIDVASSVQSGNANPVSSGAVYDYAQPIIDSTHKLASDLVDDTNQSNKFVSASEKANITKDLYHLGAYDTVDTSNADYDLITRKTGYLDLGSVSGWSIYSGDNNTRIATVKLPNYATPFNYKSSQGYSCGYDGTTLYVNVGTTNTSVMPIGLLQYETTTSYTEKVIKNQPLNTLDQRGSQWVRNEWEKTLNLWSYGNFSNGSQVTITCNYTGLVTFSISGTHTSSTGYEDAWLFRLKDSAGNYTYIYSQNSPYDRPHEQTVNGLVEVYARPNYIASGTVNIMLVEGDHAYPYQPYSGEILHKLDLLNVIYPVGAIYMSATNTNPATFLGGTWSALGVHYIPKGNVSIIMGSLHNYDLGTSELQWVKKADGTYATSGKIGVTGEHTYSTQEGTGSGWSEIAPANLWSNNTSATYNTAIYLWQRTA